MATTTAPTTTFTGLASGIDSASLIKSMVQIASQPITDLETKQSTNATISKKFTDLKTKMTTLQAAAKALDSRSEAMVNKVSSTDSNVVTVATSGGASLGAFDVQVLSVAKAERTYSDPIAASDQTGLFGTGTLSVQVGSGDPVAISVDSTDTLGSVAGKINAANVGVTAGLVFDGSQYRLQVSGNETGGDHGITFGESGGLALGLSNQANEFQAATDASVKIDNVTINSSTNSITSAVPGVTINVVGKGTAHMNVDRDPDGLKTKVDAFVKAYNDVMTVMNTESAYTGSQKAAGTLSGDSTLRSAQTSLRGVMSQSLGGLTSSFSSFGAMGISVQRDGTLSVDAGKLSAAVGKDYEGVTAVFAGVGGSAGLMSQVQSALDPYVRADGSISTRISNLATQNHDMDTQIDRIQTRIDSYEEQLQMQFAQLESAMSDMQSQGSSLAAILKNS